MRHSFGSGRFSALAILALIGVACSGSPTQPATSCAAGSLERPSRCAGQGSGVGSGPPSVSAVIAAPSALEVVVGGTAQLTGIVIDDRGVRMSNVPVLWSSSDTSIAVVSAQGNVTGRTAGVTTVVASADGVADTVSVSVGSRPIASISVTPDSTTLSEGGNVQLSATPLAGDGTVLAGRTISWSSDNSSIVSISSDGLAVARAPGSARVYAAAEGVQGEAYLEVESATSPPPSMPASLSVQAQALASDTFMALAEWSAVQGAVEYEVSGGAINGAWWYADDVATTSVTFPVRWRDAWRYWFCVSARNASGTRSSRRCVDFDPPAPSIVDVVASPRSLGLEVGETRRLDAVAIDDKGATVTNREVRWASMNSGIASVSAQGSVTGRAEGTTGVIATVEGVSDTVTVTVTDPPPAPPQVAAVVASPSSLDLLVGGTASLAAEALDNRGARVPGATIAWSTANSGVATVSSQGSVTARGEGNTIVVASSQGVSDTVRVAVSRVPVASIDVTPNSTTLSPGGTVQLSATARAANGSVLSGRSVSWTSRSPSIATVSSQGVVTAQAAGSAELVAEAEGVRGTASVVVEAQAPEPIASISVTPGSSTLSVGETVQLSATARASDGSVLSGRPITWSSRNGGVATVSSSGVVRARGAGATELVASAEGVEGTASVVVEPPAPEPIASIGVTPGSRTLSVGETVQLSATARASDGSVLSGRSITWSSRNSGVATISAQGVVRARAAGSAQLVASAEGVEGTASVTVEAATSPAPSMPSTVTIDVGSESGGSFDVQVAWSVSSGAVNYRITAGAANGSWSYNDQVGSRSATVSVPWQSGASYWLCVAGLNASGQASQNRCDSFSAPSAAPAPIAQVIASPSSVTLSEGSSQNVGATVRDQNGSVVSGASVQWRSLNTGVATVSSGGRITARNAGSTGVVASVAGVADTVTVTVNGSAPPPPPPPPPPGGGGAAVREDFSSYGSTSQLLSDPRGIFNRTEDINTGRISLDRSVGYGGSSQSMRYDYPAGSGRDYTISRMIDLENGTTEVWVEAVVRFSSNYTLQGNGQGAGAALKLLHTAVRGPSGRFGLNFEGGDNSVIRAEGPNDAYSQLYIWPNAPTAPVSSSLFDGEWHVIRHHIRLGSNDFHEFWIDGVYQGSATGRTSANELWGVSLARNLNMLSNRNMSMWWGEVGVWYSNPGW